MSIIQFTIVYLTLAYGYKTFFTTNQYLNNLQPMLKLVVLLLGYVVCAALCD